MSVNSHQKKTTTALQKKKGAPVLFLSAGSMSLPRAACEDSLQQMLSLPQSPPNAVQTGRLFVTPVPRQSLAELCTTNSVELLNNSELMRNSRPREESVSSERWPCKEPGAVACMKVLSVGKVVCSMFPHNACPLLTLFSTLSPATC